MLVALSAALAGGSAPARAGEITATSGAKGLGSQVNGVPGGSCLSGRCAIQGGTGAGANLFHRFSAFDTRGGITGVNLDVGRYRNVILGVTHSQGSFIDRSIALSAPANLVWLSPGGIRLEGGGGFTNARHLTLSTATGLRIGDGVFDVFGTGAAAARGLTGSPDLSRSGLRTDPLTLGQLGLSAQGDLSLDGGLLTVDSGLLIDAQGGHLLLGGSRLTAPGGEVDLHGQQVMLTDSTVDVSSPGGAGGAITVAGGKVTLAATRLLASGGGGGGSVRVGGGLRGADPATLNALETTVDEASSLRADATVKGHGGQVVVYASGHARVNGDLGARGGPAGGDGGLVETSAAVLELTSTPDLAAVAGRGGTWLIDPINIEIFDPSLPPASMGSDSISRLNINNLNACLNSGCQLQLDTNQAGPQAGNIYVNAGFNKVSGTTSEIQLRADRNIFINVPGSAALAFSNTSTAGGLSVSLRHGQFSSGLQGPGAAYWQNGDIALGSGNFNITQGAANAPGALVLAGDGNPLTLRSGSLRTGSLRWEPGFASGLQIGAGGSDATLLVGVLSTSQASTIRLQGSGASSLNIASSTFLNRGLIGGSGIITVGNGAGRFSNGSGVAPAGSVILSPEGDLQIRAGQMLFGDDSQLRLDLGRNDQLTVFGDAVLGGGLLVSSPPTLNGVTGLDLVRAQQIRGGFAPGAVSLPPLVRLDGITQTTDPLLPAVFRGEALPLLPAPSPPSPSPPGLSASGPSSPRPSSPRPSAPPLSASAPEPPAAAAPTPSAPLRAAATRLLSIPDLAYQIFPGTQTSPAGSSLGGRDDGEGSDALAVNLSEADFRLEAAGSGRLPGPLTTTTSTMGADQVAIAISEGDQQRSEDVRRSLGDVGPPDDAPGSLRVDELQRLLQEASRKGDGDDERFNPAVLMVAFTEAKGSAARPSGGSPSKAANSFLDLILLSRQGEPLGQRVELSREQFGAQLRALYRQLARLEPLQVENPDSPSRQLHRAIIGPVAEELQRRGITTLVIVADRGLQALPFAALHDGRSYFGDRYGFALTPSLNLTSLAPPRQTRGRVLAAGASEFDSLSPLPLVNKELAGIPEGVGVDRYLNRSFTPAVLLTQAADSRYERLHVATHAEFLPGGPAQARIYTGTGPVSLKDFSRLRQQRSGSPLELFVLSACRTALGDADSEMGFAGLALQAGSRSAIGTLWYVDDVATSAYFLQLYRYLDQGLQKSEALRATRRAMATGTLRLQGDKVVSSDGVPLLTGLSPSQQRRIARGMNHPYFWAGVQLIGTPW
ncbi:CHAT domain-containing protein [Synechococcus sp. CCY 9618]|uniref:CHAT domain-containing protein n=1 Tax=Synechococcus sp. CCY 9618 TaxID=2815602 RepID=UPI001C23AF4C|nr:CHAT domain-containing protein [Synechococcus sp. CCY 9618]